MRDGWARLPLGDLLTLEYGKGLPEPERVEGPFPVFGSAGIVGWHSTPLVTQGPVIVVGRKGTAGAVHWSEAPCWPIDTTYYAVLGPRLTPRFAWLALQWADLPSMCAQTGVPGLNRERAYEVEVAVPTPAEQRRIADLVGAVDDYATACRQLASVAMTSYQALLDAFYGQAMAAVSLAPLGEVATTRLGKMLDAKRLSGDAYPYLANVNVQWDEVKTDGLKTVPLTEREREELKLVANDVLVCEGGEAGRTAVVAHDLPGIYFQKAIHRVRCGPMLLPRFLLHFMRFATRSGTLDDFLSAVTIQHLTGEKLRQVPVPLPPLRVQESAVALLDAALTLGRRASACDASAGVARTAMMKELLSGEHEIPASYDRVLDDAA